MQVVFDPPVIPQGLPIHLRLARATADKAPHFTGDFAFSMTLTGAHPDHAQVLPRRLAWQLGILDHLVKAGFFSTVTAFLGLITAVARVGAPLVRRRRETGLDVGPQTGLIIFHGQEVVPTLSDDFGGDF